MGPLESNSPTWIHVVVERGASRFVALITDFYEGGSVTALLAAAGRLNESRVTTLGLAALDDGAGAAFDRNIAERMAGTGMEVAAMSPRRFAEWIGGVIA